MWECTLFLKILLGDNLAKSLKTTFFKALLLFCDVELKMISLEAAKKFPASDTWTAPFPDAWRLSNVSHFPFYLGWERVSDDHLRSRTTMWETIWPLWCSCWQSTRLTLISHKHDMSHTRIKQLRCFTSRRFSARTGQGWQVGEQKRSRSSSFSGQKTFISLYATKGNAL